MSTPKAGQLKPFMLEEKKDAHSRSVSEVTFNKWQGCMLANIKKEEKWLQLLSTTWQSKKSENRGFTGADADSKATQVDMMLEYVAQFAPNHLYRDITNRATSLSAIWTLVRNWAGLKTSGCKQQTYYAMKNSYDPNGDLTATDFFFSLRNAKEDCLLLSRENGGKIKFQGFLPTEDEDLTPTLESDIVLDWMDAVGGSKLVENVFKSFSKELETESLADLRQRITECLSSLMNDTETVDVSRAHVPPPFKPKPPQFKFPPFSPPGQSRKPKPFKSRQTHSQSSYKSTSNYNPRPNAPCKLCLATKPQVAHTHDITTCNQLSNTERRHIAGAILADVPDPYETFTHPSCGSELYDDDQAQDTEEDSNEEDSYYSNPSHTVKTCAAEVFSGEVVQIKRVNIHESPILACSYQCQTIYLVLDTGATSSIITIRMAKLLNLHVEKTSHKAVQVDGESQLPVLGEVHTTFSRGALKLHFSGLVVSRLGVDILAGTNFHVENDVYSRMAKGTIHIGDHCVVQSSPPSLLTLDSLDRRSKQRLVKVPQNSTILPGDCLSFQAPTDMAPDSVVLLEPNLQQTTPFFSSTIVPLNNGCFEVSNETSEAVTLKKNCQAFSLYTTSTEASFPSSKNLFPAPIQRISPKDIIKDVVIDGNLSTSEKQPLLDAISAHCEIFQPTLPGYNHSFGPVYASFSFASKARPVPQKLRFPDYGSHQNILFNQKCQQLKDQGVLIDPVAEGIQPILTHNSWVVKKPSSASLPWEKCSLKDVRLVVGLDPFNKYLADPPGKVTKTDTVYASLAQWQFMGELDFSDFYFQMKFRQQTEKDKQKLGYLCIRTALGTLTFTSAIMGLLGMDVFQDELTDKIFGDLVLSGHLVKMADNIYFGSDTLPNFVKLFKNILERIDSANLRIKASKMKLNIQSADILGLHWSKGTLSPSSHKLDPLAHCEPPKSVSALRSWLGSVRFNEICLPGAKLAYYSKPLDAQIPANRSGKDIIKWTPDLLSSFQTIQQILAHPLSVTIPRQGDTIYLATDACTSLPAGGTKMFISRPGTQGFLPSFNFGCRLPATLKEWSPCEVEAFFLNKGIEKTKFYTNLSGNPSIALTDSKPVFQAKQKLDQGKFSASKRLQDLLVNLSSKRFTIQLLSAKLPSSILKMVDFASRHPVKCTHSSCTICKDTSAAVCAVSTEYPNPMLLSPAAWKDIQMACPDLKRVHALLSSGKQPSKKEKKVEDIRTYLRKCTINKQGILVILKPVPFQAKPNELPVIPKAFAYTFAKALHNKLNHPTPHQMKIQFNRRYFMLNEDAILKQVFDFCDVPCQASKILRKETMSYSTETKSQTAGQYLNADVMVESGQQILVIRDNLTSYTDTVIIKNQTKPVLKEALLVSTSRFKLGDTTYIRVDGQSSLSSLSRDRSLESAGLFLLIGRPKNVNKNATVDKAIRELREQLIKIQPEGGPYSPTILAQATYFLNSIIRFTGRSARELWLSRDQQTGANISLQDSWLSDVQFENRQKSHNSSASYASHNGKPVTCPRLSPGDTVFVKSDLSKSKARPSFFVLETDDVNQLAKIQKFPMSNFRHHPIVVEYQNLFKPSSASQMPNILSTPIHDLDLDTSIESFRPKSALPTSKPFFKLSQHPHYTPDSDSDSSSEYDSAQSEPGFNINGPPSPEAQEDNSFNEETDSNPSLPDETLPIPPTSVHLYQPIYGQPDYLKPGEIVLLVVGDNWLKVELNSHSGTSDAYGGSLYWNYTSEDGSYQNGGYLLPGQSWGVLRGADKDIDVAETSIILPAGHASRNDM